MRHYWLYLEPYTYADIIGEKGIVYNTLNGKLFSTCDAEILSMITILNDEKSMYVMEINELEKEETIKKKFIGWLKETYSGDIIQKESIYKPVQFISKLYFSNENSAENESNGYDIYKSLFELTIYLNSNCNNSCLYCNAYNKQFISCKKNGSSFLELLTVKEIINKTVFLSKINFLGGNILFYPYIDDLLHFLDKISATKCFYFNILQIDYPSDLLKFEMSDAKIFILINQYADNETIDTFYNYLKNKRINFEFIFIIENEHQFENFINKTNKEISMKPFFNGNNYHFFNKYVFLDKNDVLLLKRDLLFIFRQRVFNDYFYGKLIIDVKGDIYTSFNLFKIGNVTHDLSSILLNALHNDSAWKLIKSKLKPCISCMYNFICTPISDYELAIGKPNLCHVKP
jgi:pseudo-rSAM protein